MEKTIGKQIHDEMMAQMDELTPEQQQEENRKAMEAEQAWLKTHPTKTNRSFWD